MHRKWKEKNDIVQPTDNHGGDQILMESPIELTGKSVISKYMM